MSDSTMGGAAGAGDRRRAAVLAPALSFARAGTRTGRETFPSLDALRAASALMIVLYHARSMAANDALRAGAAIVGEPRWWLVCLDLFFTMSGFLMVHVSRALYGSRRGPGVFLARRLVRTPPLYWLYTLLFAAAWSLFPGLPGATPIDGWRLAHNLLFIPDGALPILPIAWTLYLEVLFYLVFAPTLLLPFRWGPLAAAGALGALAGLGLCWASLPPAVFSLWTDPFLLDFCFGIGIAALFFRGATLHLPGQVAVLAVAVAALAAIPDMAPRSGLHAATFGVAAACLVALATLSERDPLPRRWRAGAAALGGMGYSLYLSHPTALKLVEIPFFRAFAGPAAPYGFIAVGFAAALAGGWAAHRLVEVPLARRLRPLAPPAA